MSTEIMHSCQVVVVLSQMILIWIFNGLKRNQMGMSSTIGGLKARWPGPPAKKRFNLRYCRAYLGGFFAPP